MDKLKQIACKVIDDESEQLQMISNEIWQHRELAFLELKSHASLTQVLEDKGFDVERHHKLETAFVARWGDNEDESSKNNSKKPHIAVICEYDALPDIGHACGHNLIAEIGVGAGLAIKTAMQQSELSLGKLSIIGTPAEEAGGGKIDLLKAGVFDDVDVAMMSHPAPFTDARPIFLGGKRFMANFHGRASHAAGYPWEAVNALDAAVLAYMNVAALRQQMRPEWRASAIITKGGTRTNIIPDETQLALQVRAPIDSEVKALEAKVKTCVHAAATATGCTVDIVDLPKPYECLVTNETLARLYETNGSLVGVAFPPQMPKKVLGSTDMGNVSHHVPSLHPTYHCDTDAINHTHEFNAAAGSPEAQPSTLAQAKALAMVALDIFQQPQLLESIREDFQNDLNRL
ncbi:peptidase m20 domain-containing protein 2 [Plakobranchus ocellatus]|uniref:Peptidase M20 domain-containing protein 2 n=1 Tax=Plakobranchus ocellatus TaxID=259542 RepID=A0AAV3YV57_9GAST|nr:peptidase m20 domain-containing protein 2 [Plakobranchus ocellatus]